MLIFATSTLTNGNETEIIAAPGATTFIRIYSHDATNGASAILRMDVKENTTVKLSRYLAANGGGFLDYFDDQQNAEKGTGGLITWDLPLNTALKAQLSGVPASNDVRYNVRYLLINTA